ncbi:MAG: hypothetical protein ABIT76_08625 [Chthoniobacterales bacterium]
MKKLLILALFALSLHTGQSAVTVTHPEANVFNGATSFNLTLDLSGVTNKSTVRSALGLAIGSNIQAWDADLDTIAASPATAIRNFLTGGTGTLDLSGFTLGLTKSTVGLGNVDNTSDANKPVSTAQATANSAVATAAATDATTKANAAQAAAVQRSNHTGTQSADTLTDGTTNKAFLATERTKLAGIATGATANSSDATLLNRSNHTGTQSADTLTDGTTNKAFLATERTKLTGIATGATANSSDATLLNRANHTGTQLLNTISDRGTAAGVNTGTTSGTIPVLGTGGVLADGTVTVKRGVTNANVIASDLFASHAVASTVHGTTPNLGPTWNVTYGTGGNGETAPNLGGYVSFTDSLWNSTVASACALYLNQTHSVVPKRWGNEVAFLKSTGVVGGSNTLILQPSTSLANLVHCSLASTAMKIEITTVGGGPAQLQTLASQAITVPTDGTHWVFEVEMSQTVVANDTITIRAGAPGTTLTSLSATDSNLKGTVTVNTGTDLATVSTTHGLSAGQMVRFTTTGTLPSPLVAGTDYFVIASGLTSTALKVSATSGGSAIDITTSGTGTHSIYQRWGIPDLFAAGTMKITTCEVYANVLPATEKVRIYSTWVASDTTPANSADLIKTANSNAVTGLLDAVSLQGYSPTFFGLQLLNLATSEELANKAGQAFTAKTNVSNTFDDGTSQTIYNDGGGTPSKGLRIKKSDGGTNLKTLALQAVGDGGLAVNQLTDANAFSYRFINFTQPGGYSASSPVMALTWNGVNMTWGPQNLTAAQGVATSGLYFIGQPAAVTALTDAATITQPDSNSNVMKVQLAAGSARTMAAPHAGFGGEGYTIKFFVKQPASGAAATISFPSGNGYKTTGFSITQSTANNATDYYEFVRVYSGNFCLVRFVANIE